MKRPTEFEICYPKEFSEIDGATVAKIQYEKRVINVEIPEGFEFYRQLLEMEHRNGVLRNMWYAKAKQGG